MLRGRFFSKADSRGAPLAAVVNEAFVRRFMGNMDPLAQRLRIVPWRVLADGSPQPQPAEYQIVGVYRDVLNTANVTEEKQPEILVSLDQADWPFVGFAIRTEVDPAAVIASLRGTVAATMPGTALERVQVMAQTLDEQRSTDRFEMVLFGCFAGIALLLSAVGIYGVMAFVVAQRTQEMGIRMALGAERGDVVRLMLRSGLRLAAGGVAIGIAGAWLLGHAMHSTLYGMETVDMTSLLAVGALLLAVAVTACWIPARRAAGVNPMKALRME